ncbi:MAG TPA: hypothetical protein VI387_04250 [Candidatus Brocadiales bacterium]|nr:hypothetical protein [Candidatus Brocadiales bacterium]
MMLDIILGIDILAINILFTSKEFNMGVVVQEGSPEKITTSFLYDPALVATVKTIPDHRW